MEKLKKIGKALLPPALLSAYRRVTQSASHIGDYASWAEALENSTGYDSDVILDKASSALLNVQSGKAAYERDSVLFEQVEYSFPLLCGLLHAAVANKGKLTVLDFGGALGSTYFQCRKLLSVVHPLAWCIVEQEKFVRRGQELFETDQLRFFYSVDECFEAVKPDLVLLSSVLQYIETPFELLRTIMSSSVPYILIDRTPFTAMNTDHLCVQHVPPEIYPASYPCWIFGETKFNAYLQEQYELMVGFDGTVDGVGSVGDVPFYHRGMIWKRR